MRDSRTFGRRVNRARRTWDTRDVQRHPARTCNGIRRDDVQGSRPRGNIGPMRRRIASGLAAVLGVLVGCGDETQAAPVEPHLVLELGGDQPTITEVLRRAAPPISGGVEQQEPAPVPDEPPPSPELRERAPVRTVTVRLPEGYTLIRLCRERLGDGERWREVAALNGWTEADLRRLAPNTPVELPTR